MLIHRVERAVEAPIVRRLFASSPKDPRYHMLSHLSSKFTLGYQVQQREPRAAFFLNRFTRSLSIMYATPSIVDIFGLTADEVMGRSFYYCIQQNCLQDAIRCLESAKANDSIAYLRFWFRDPRQDVEPNDSSSSDQEMSDITMAEEDSDEEGGVQLNFNQRCDSMELGNNSDDSNVSLLHQSNGIFDNPQSASSSNSSLGSESGSTHNQDLEIEAVVSCTSDGLVVVLRRARPLPPRTGFANVPIYTNGLFASPWGADPIIPPPRQSSMSPGPESVIRRSSIYKSDSPVHSPVNVRKSQPQDFMMSIRDVAAFAWSLTGINGTIADYGVGKPSGESQPPNGLPVWSQDPQIKTEPDVEDAEDQRRAAKAPLAPNSHHGHGNFHPSSNTDSTSPNARPETSYRPPSQQRDFATHYDPQFDGFARSSDGVHLASKNGGETECLYPHRW